MRVFVLLLLQAVILLGSFANAAPRFATLDWTVAETLLALEQPPVAVGDAQSYQKWVAEPALPENVVDLGIRLQPNLEQVAQLAEPHSPLIFINSGFYAQATPKLTPFSEKVEIVNFYGEGEAWQNVLTATQQIAAQIGKPEAFNALMQRYSQKIAEIRPLVAPYVARPVALVQFIDTRHLRIYAPNSLFGAVLTQLGFKNAWQGSHNMWGFETIEVTQLAKLPANSRLVVVKPYPANIRAALQYNVLWQKLALAQDPLILPTIWSFGAVPSAQRFAQLLAQGLMLGGEKW